jgi:hypothetical protein
VRLLARIISAIVVVIAFAGCSGSPRHAAPSTSGASAVPSSTTTSVAVQRFSSGNGFGLTFKHPRTWIEAPYTRTSSFTSLITYLSNAKLHDPCTTTHDVTGTTTACGDPISVLPPGGVLVNWSAISYPHVAKESDIHPNLTVDGRPAQLTVAKPGSCSRMGAQQTITVDIEFPRAGNYDEMVACLREPGTAKNAALVRQMIASTRVSG